MIKLTQFFVLYEFDSIWFMLSFVAFIGYFCRLTKTKGGQRFLSLAK